MIQRQKNLQSLLELEFDFKTDVRDMCLGLTAADLEKGPVPDDKGRPGEVWVFKPEYRGTRMYLKFLLQSSGSVDHITIVSCHREGMIES
jgi:hypothetical protein